MGLFDFFKTKKQDNLKVCIGNKVLRVAEPVAKRYYNLLTLLDTPKFEVVEDLQKQMESKYTELLQASDTKSIYAEIQAIQKNLTNELSKHSIEISSFFQKQNYDTLKKIVECVCEGTVTIEDIENCYEIQVKVAVDFFLTKHLKTSIHIAQQSLQSVNNLSNRKKKLLKRG